MRRKGVISRDLGALEEAKSYLTQAYGVSVKNQDSQEALQALLYLTNIHISEGAYNAASDKLSHFDEFSGAGNYEVFLGLKDISVSKIHQASGDFDLALKHYSAGLVRLAQNRGYGHARLNSIIDTLDALLDDLPNMDIRRNWCNSLMKCWQDEGLTEVLPRLCRTLSIYLDALGIGR